MGAVKQVPELIILSKTPSTYVDAKRTLVTSTFVVYKDEKGRVGSIVIKKDKPTDDDVKKAVADREAGR